MRVYNLKCESMTNPLGISITSPRLTWNLASHRRSVRQQSFLVTVWEEVWDHGTLRREQIFSSGETVSRDTALILPAELIRSRSRYHWTVQVTDNYGETALSQEDAWFEMGLLLETNWSARWIEPQQHPVYKEEIPVEEYISDLQTFHEGKRRWAVDESKSVPAEETTAQSHEIREDILYPCPMLRRCFTVSGQVVRARMYATAHGIYAARLNGQRVGDMVLAPESSPYFDYLQVQTYDLEELIREGENTIGVTLADGWWAGRLGCTGESARYGDTLGLLLQIELYFADGHTETVGSDAGFVSTLEGPRRYADLSIGEKFDANRVLTGWSQPGFDDSGWTAVTEKSCALSNLRGQNAQPMRYLKELPLAKSYVSPQGDLILDFGQLMAGTAAMHLTGEPGSVVVLRYFQVTDQDGNYYYETMGENSQMTDTVVLDQNGQAEYDPLFTLHGYRYIAITADRGTAAPTQCRARLLATDIDVTARIVTSNPKLNKLQENIEWTIRSDMLSIPADNPDRERSGWTGDAQMIGPTICYHVDAQAMLRRWLVYCRHEQGSGGEVPAIIPNWRVTNAIATDSTAGWGDVVIHLPWHLYWKYGDIRILEENYPMMQRWLELVKKRAADANPPWIGEITPERAEDLQYIWNADWNFGDWMTPSASVDEKTGEIRIGAMCLCWLMGTYYFAYSTVLLEKTAALLQKEEDAAMYHALYEKIRQAAVHEFYDTGKIYESRYPGAQILALHMGFYREGEKDRLMKRILEQLELKGMDTGFSSSLVLPQLLCENGNAEKMYDFLLNESKPSWLYQVNQGATAVWESMEGIQPDGSIAMCSFIQMAYCSIGNWMMEGMAGISAAKPGFTTIRIHPHYTDRLDYVDASYLSQQGEIACRWAHTEAGRELRLGIPANTTAEVFLEGASIHTAKADNGDVNALEGLSQIYEEQNGLLLVLGSGEYAFSWDVAAQ